MLIDNPKNPACCGNALLYGRLQCRNAFKRLIDEHSGGHKPHKMSEAYTAGKALRSGVVNCGGKSDSCKYLNGGACYRLSPGAAHIKFERPIDHIRGAADFVFLLTIGANDTNASQHLCHERGKITGFLKRFFCRFMHFPALAAKHKHANWRAN
ncbi:hypothetical protein MnTg02_01531 [bacterium MnTg02]|nr:hypothetical protein MnTg02_01531 [bacterium MnTg02]